MGDRTDLPKIKPDSAPSMFNHEAGTGGVIGLLIALVPSTILELMGKSNRIKTAITTSGIVLGALYGGSKGKVQQEKELQEGRTVKDAGYFNKGILSGLTVGMLINAPFLLLNRTQPLGLLTTGVAIITGSVMRKNSLQRDFDKAAVAQIDKLNSLTWAPAAAVSPEVAHAKITQLTEVDQKKFVKMPGRPPETISYKNSVTAAEAAALAEKQETKSQSHAAVTQHVEQHQEAARA